MDYGGDDGHLDDDAYWVYGNEVEIDSDAEIAEQEEQLEQIEERSEEFKAPKKRFVPNDKRMSRSIVSKFEFAKILTERIKEINNGAELLIGNEYKGKQDIISIARYEICNKLVPVIIERLMPGGAIEQWTLEDLEIPLKLKTNNYCR